jgi:hypothetical protein
MFSVPVEDFIFVVCALIGGGLLLITVLVDDILGALFEFDVGGVSLMPLLLSFVSMFGVGGLFATQILDVHRGEAALWGAGFGLVGLGLAYAIFSALRRAEAAEPFSTSDLSVTRHTSRSPSRPAGTAASSSRPRARPTSSARPHRPTSPLARSPASPAWPAQD